MWSLKGIVSERDRVSRPGKISYLLLCPFVYFLLCPLAKGFPRAIFWFILLWRLEKWLPERSEGRGGKAANRHGEEPCVKGESGQRMTLDNFVLNFSVISSQAISLTFSCGI